jgi:DNA invertase Pin-like site-specific DNA recombinase
MRVVAYLRLSKAEGGHGLDVQRRAVEAFCERRGYELVRVEADDGASGRSTRKRPGLQRALDALRNEGASAIVATRVDRLARSSLDFHRIVADVQKAGATVLFTEQESFSLDTPEGRMLVGILASFAAFEADLISARTKAALMVVKQNGSRSGKPIGNPNYRPTPRPIVALIQQLRAEGMSYARVAAELNRRGIPTAQGGRMWHARTVNGIVRRTEATAA